MGTSSANRASLAWVALRPVQRARPNGSRFFLYQVFRRWLAHTTENLVDVIRHKKEHRGCCEEDATIVSQMVPRFPRKGMRRLSISTWVDTRAAFAQLRLSKQ